MSIHPLRDLGAALALGWAGLAAGATAPALPDLDGLATVPRVTLPAAAVEHALATTPRPIMPLRYAVPVALAMDITQGQWTRPAAAVQRWRLRVASPDARSLGLRLADVALPQGAELRAFDPRGAQVRGPYGPADITPTGLWIAPLAGAEIVLELQVPAGTSGAVRIGNAESFHGFRDWQAKAGEGGPAGACNVDITCPQAVPWQDDANSVARISIGNQFVCSGQLLNNVEQDKRRLFITANHCGIEEGYGPDESVMFYFGYEGPCPVGGSPGNGTDPLPDPTFEGSTRLAHDISSDFTLLLIDSTTAPPDGITLVFAGWDATGAGSMSGASIHHPQGDEKKISFYSSPVVEESVDIRASCAIDAWRVRWDEGTTEVGSSGGGLWNSDHELIGILSGGSADCENPNGFDYYARIDRGWTANPSAEGQLKAHLDPNDTCIAKVPRLSDDANNPQPINNNNRRCFGEASTCAPGAAPSGSGFLLGSLGLPAIVLLGLAAALRRRQNSSVRTTASL